MTPPGPNTFQFDGKETKAKDQVDPNGYYKKKAQSHIQWKQSQTEVLDFIKKNGYGFRYEGSLRFIVKLIYMYGPGLARSLEASIQPWTIHVNQFPKTPEVTFETESVSMLLNEIISFRLVLLVLNVILGFLLIIPVRVHLVYRFRFFAVKVKWIRAGRCQL